MEDLTGKEPGETIENAQGPMKVNYSGTAKDKENIAVIERAAALVASDYKVHTTNNGYTIAKSSPVVTPPCICCLV